MPRFHSRPCHVDISHMKQQCGRNPLSFPLHEQAVLHCLAAMSLDDDDTSLHQPSLVKQGTTTTRHVKPSSSSSTPSPSFVDSATSSMEDDVEMEDSWGQFIDPAEAEQEVIRFSGFLPQPRLLHRFNCSPVNESWGE